MKNNFLEIELEDNAKKIINRVTELYVESTYQDLAPISNEFYSEFISAVPLNQAVAGQIHTDWNSAAINYLKECGTIGVFAFRLRCLVAAIKEVLLSTYTPEDQYSFLEKISCVSLLGMEAAARHTAAQIAHSILHSELIPELRNKKAFKVDFESKGKTAERLTITYIDMDGLKALNDSQNHAAGDAALRRLGEGLRKLCLEHQTAYHFSGDEFGILSIDEDPDRLVAQLEKLLEHSPNKFSYGISTGTMRDSLDSIVNTADENMQAQKKWRKEHGGALIR